MKWLLGRASQPARITFFHRDFARDTPGFPRNAEDGTPSSFESNYDFQKADSVIEYYACDCPRLYTCLRRNERHAGETRR